MEKTITLLFQLQLDHTVPSITPNNEGQYSAILYLLYTLLQNPQNVY